MEKVIRLRVFNKDSQIVFSEFWESNSDNVLFMQDFDEFLRKNDGEFEIEIDHYVSEELSNE